MRISLSDVSLIGYMFWRDAHSQRWRVWKAAVRTSRLKHLLTCQLRLIRLSMTHAVIISSGEDLFFSLWHIDLLGSHQRCAVKANINKHVKSSFLDFRITKALQISRFTLSRLSYLCPIPDIGMPDMSSRRLRDALLLQFLQSCHQPPLWPEENPSCIEGVEERVYAEVLMNVIFEERVVRRVYGGEWNLKGKSGIEYL